MPKRRRDDEDDEPEENDGPDREAAEIRRLYDEGARAIGAMRREYWTNHSYVMGEQYLFWNPQTSQIESLNRDPDRVQATVNHMLPASRTVVSKLTSRRLVFQVNPTAADDGTLRAAKMAESILTSMHRTHKWEDVREDAAWAAWKGGTAALCVDWDPTLGQELGQTDEGEAFGLGDTVETALAIVDFIVEPGVRDAELGRYWIKGIALPPKAVQEHFGLKKEPQADASAGMTPFQREMFEDHAGGRAGGGPSDLTLVLSYYERPNKLHPDGKIAYIVGGKVVKSSRWTFPFKDRLNLVIMRETRIDGKWWGTTVLRSARSVQNGINQSWSSIIEHMKLAGNARLAVPQSVYDQWQSLTDLPGELIGVPDGSTAPQWLSPPQMPMWWIEEPLKLKEEMDDILGVHDVSKGDAPPNIQSGLGLSILIEMDATPVGRMAKEQASCWGRLGTMILQIVESKVKEKREAIIKVPGQPPESREWIGRDLQGQTEAEVPVESVMPRNRAQQFQFAQEAAKMGLLTDPAALARFVKLADIPGSLDLLEGLAPDVAKARRENAMMFMGVIPDPESMDFDDHNIHGPEHLTAMKSPRWDETAPLAKAIFRAHMQAHATLSAEQLGGQVAKAEVNPVLASAVDPRGAPALPLSATGPAALGAPPGPAPAGPATPSPGPGAQDVPMEAI